MQQYLHKGHNLFIDNHYTSMSLAQYFTENGTYVTGTIRDNRKNFPTQLREVSLNRGGATYYNHGDIAVVKIQRKQKQFNWTAPDVYVLSAGHSAAMGNTTKKDRDGNIIQLPTSIISYNHNMGGVDFVDQQLDALHVLRKSYKWYEKLFMRLVIQCALASHKLYKKEGGKDDFLYFLLEVCTQLIQYSRRFEGPRRPPSDKITKLTGQNQWSAKRGSPENWKGMQSTTKWCTVCTAKGRNTTGDGYIKTSGICKGCQGEPGLCVPKCFEEFQTKLDFDH